MAERGAGDEWAAWRVGLHVACRQHALVLLAVFAVACERALTIGMDLAGGDLTPLGKAMLGEGLSLL